MLRLLVCFAGIVSQVKTDLMCLLYVAGHHWDSDMCWSIFGDQEAGCFGVPGMMIKNNVIIKKKKNSDNESIVIVIINNSNITEIIIH